MQTTEEIVDYLEHLKNSYLQKQKKTTKLVNKKTNLLFMIATVLFFLSTVGLGIYGGIQFFKTIPYLTAVNRADNAYIENDKIALIDALKSISVEEMDVHQKYILAKAYLQSESLTDEQKTNILEKISLKTNIKELEYWIYICRLEAKQAEEKAMQLSDDELLLYAYMLDKSQTESNTTISGEEKEQSLKDIQSKIDELTKKYDIEKETETKDADILLGGE